MNVRGLKVPYFIGKMIDKAKVQSLIDEHLKEGFFVVDFNISSSNKIILTVDAYQGVTINDCVDLSRGIEHNLDRDIEDFSLEVASAGLSLPFKVWDQYKKNQGRQVEILLEDSSIIKGLLKEVDREKIIVEETKRVKVENSKKKKNIIVTHELGFNSIKTCKVIISFK